MKQMKCSLCGKDVTSQKDVCQITQGDDNISILTQILCYECEMKMIDEIIKEFKEDK